MCIRDRRYAGQLINAGTIIVRQRGSSFHAGTDVGMGKDYTLFALKTGVVKFEVKGPKNRKHVSIVASEEAAA